MIDKNDVIVGNGDKNRLVLVVKMAGEIAHYYDTLLNFPVRSVLDIQHLYSFIFSVRFLASLHFARTCGREQDVIQNVYVVT